MKPSEQEKQALEHNAAKLFMRLYEKATRKEIRHIWHNQPSKPDVSCWLEGERLDLEIAHLYGSEQEAMSLLGRELTARTREELVQLQSETDVNVRLTKALNNILHSKAKKSYQSKRVWLVIRNVHPAWDKSIIEYRKAKFSVPDKHPFDAIWMVADFKGQSGLVRLFPSESGQH